MSITAELTRVDIRSYLRGVLPEVNLDRKQIHIPCPIHNGVRDSFSLNTETGQWFCNSDCGRGGDIVDLEMALTNRTKKEALDSLEEMFQIQRPAYKPTPRAALPPAPAPSAAPAAKLNIKATYPYHDADGKLLFEVVRLEPKSFRQRRPNGRGGWDWSRGNVPMVPYHLPELRSATGPVFVVEGEKDADRLRGLGLTATCNPGGAGKWLAEYGLYFEGKSVIVIPDQDEPKTKGVKFPGQQHAVAIMRSVIPYAGKVALLHLPGAKDVSDYLDNHAPDDFAGLVATATTISPILIDEYERMFANDPQPQEAEAPAVDAAQIVQAVTKALSRKQAKAEDNKRHINAVADEVLKEHDLLVDNAENVYEYNGSYWKVIEEPQVHTYALKAESKWHTRRSRRGEIADYVMLQARNSSAKWNNIAEYEVAVENGVIDIRNGEIRSHRREDYLDTVLPVEYRPTADCPVWKTACGVWWGADEDYKAKLAAVQEFCGYVLMPHAKYKRALLVWGEPDSGKSQLALTLEELVGRENVCGVAIKDMDDQRRLAPIKGKMLNSLSELPHGAMISDGGFKKLVSTGDSIQIDQKFKPAESYVPRAKHVIVTNSLPRVDDLSNAVYNRLMLIAFNYPLPPEKRDPNLLKKLIAERPGILNWCIEGARRLYEHEGRFTEIAESKQLIEKYKREMNAINDFVAIYCRKSEGNSIVLNDLRERFNAWKKDRAVSLNIVRKMARQAFGAAAIQNDRLEDYAWI